VTWTTLAAVALLVAIGAAPASGAPAKDDPRKQRAEVKQKEADVAAQVDALKASNTQVKTALDALNANVASQEAAVADAQAAAEQAKVAAAQAKAAEAAAEANLRALRTDLQQLAVEAYVDPAVQNPSVALLKATNLSDAVSKRALIGLRAGGNLDITDKVEAAREDLTAQRQAADTAVAAAAAQQTAVESKLSDLQAAKAQQQQFADNVTNRLNASLAESANLATLDQTLANQIAAEDAALAARAAAGRGSSKHFTSGTISLTTVRGITVATSIADNLDAMLGAAAGDGFVLGGGGYRDPQAQIELRREHCGTSDYDIYDKPASQCHPPTAPPGYSMHEQGLAVDFTWNGTVIASHSSPAFQWLAAHAAHYGFYNLASEPWHWSVNGN
jgi:peptidoglycan hydrolase CwlO-like protein